MDYSNNRPWRQEEETFGRDQWARSGDRAITVVYYPWRRLSPNLADVPFGSKHYN
jgi:hypothetical protein